MKPEAICLVSGVMLWYATVSTLINTKVLTKRVIFREVIKVCAWAIVLTLYSAK